jgi:hypothetical protein
VYNLQIFRNRPKDVDTIISRLKASLLSGYPNSVMSVHKTTGHEGGWLTPCFAVLEAAGNNLNLHFDFFIISGIF